MVNKIAVNTFGLCPRAISFTNEYCINSWIFNNYRFINEEIDHLSLTLAQMALSQTRQLKVLDTNWKFQKGDFEDALK
jgi:hypothetical protein